MKAPYRHALLALSIYGAVTALQGRGVIRHAADHLPMDAGDPVLNASILTWNARHWPLTGAWWDFPGFHPTSSTLALSEHLMGLSLFATPVVQLTGDPILAYNLLFLATFVLSAIGAYALAYALTGSAPAAFLAGLVFGFAPYRASQLSHLQVLASFWMPVALLSLHSYIRTRRASWLALFGAAWLLQAMTNGYYLVFFSLLIGLWVVWFVVAQRKWQVFSAIVVILVLAAVPLIPFLFRYATVHAAIGLSREFQEITRFSADMLSLLNASPQLSFWGWVRVFDRPEGALFPGVALPLLLLVASLLLAREGNGVATGRTVRAVQTLLVAAAVVSAAAAATVYVFGPWRVDVPALRISASEVHKPLSLALVFMAGAVCAGERFRCALRRASPATFYAGAALLTWLLTLGPRPTLSGQEILYEAPYNWLLRLPAVDQLRVPSRFWMVTLVCLATLAALLFARVTGRMSGRRRLAVTAMVAVGLLADGWVTIPVVAAPRPLPALESSAAGSNVLELPLGDLFADAAAQYRAVMGGWKTFNGYSGYLPASYAILGRALEHHPDEAIGVLREYGDLTVVVHASDDPHLRWTSLARRQPGATHVADGGDVVVSRLPAMPRSQAGDSRQGLPVRSIEASCAQEHAQLMLDGDPASRWQCPQVRDEYVLVELDGPQAVVSVTQYLGAAALDYPALLRIETSVDGVSWEPAWHGPGVVAALAGALRDLRRIPVQFGFSPRIARFVRLLNEGRDADTYWSIAALTISASR
jgi:hypothetical protein